MTVAERVLTIVAEVAEVNVNHLTPQTTFASFADSFEDVEIVMRCEEEFELEIPDEDAGKLMSIDDLIEYIERHTE